MSGMLSKEEVHKIAGNDDFHIAPYREDGNTPGTPTWIWSVMVNDELYVRAYNGTGSRWYQAALKQKGGMIRAAGMERQVSFEPVTGSINDQIDDAYREKYSDSPYLQPMISQGTREATMKVF